MEESEHSKTRTAASGHHHHLFDHMQAKQYHSKYTPHTVETLQQLYDSEEDEKYEEVEELKMEEEGRRYRSNSVVDMVKSRATPTQSSIVDKLSLNESGGPISPRTSNMELENALTQIMMISEEHAHAA